MEENAFQALKNNAIGTMAIAEEAVAGGVKSFTLISTDKAVNPTNIMLSQNVLPKSYVRRLKRSKIKRGSQSCVFGNVLGSSGS